MFDQITDDQLRAELERRAKQKARDITENNNVQSIKAIVVLFITSLALDFLCNEFSVLYRFSILSYGLTLASILAVLYKAFDYVLPEINFFDNWKGDRFEVPAKASVVVAILFCITWLLYTAGSTDTKGASPKEPIRTEITIENKTNSQISSDTLQKED